MPPNNNHCHLQNGKAFYFSWAFERAHSLELCIILTYFGSRFIVLIYPQDKYRFVLPNFRLKSSSSRFTIQVDCVVNWSEIMRWKKNKSNMDETAWSSVYRRKWCRKRYRNSNIALSDNYEDEINKRFVSMLPTVQTCTHTHIYFDWRV